MRWYGYGLHYLHHFLHSYWFRLDGSSLEEFFSQLISAHIYFQLWISWNCITLESMLAQLSLKAIIRSQVWQSVIE